MTQTKRDTQPTPQPAANDVAEAVAEHVKCIAKQQSSGRYKLTSAARDAISAGYALGRAYQDDDCFAEARDILRHRQQAAIDAAWKMFNERAAMHGTAAAGGILTAFGSVSLMFPPLAPVGAVAVAVGLAASTSGGIAALIHEPRAVEAAEEMLAKLQAKHKNFAIKAIYHIQKALNNPLRFPTPIWCGSWPKFVIKSCAIPRPGKMTSKRSRGSKTALSHLSRFTEVALLPSWMHL